MTESDDRELTAILTSIDQASWSALPGLIADLESVDAAYVWRGGDGVQPGVIQMPWPDHHPAVDRVTGWLCDNGLVTPLVEWTSWAGIADYTSPSAVAQGPIADMVRLATALVRGERFCDGTVAAAVDRGVLAALLTRLHTWHRTPTS